MVVRDATKSLQNLQIEAVMSVPPLKAIGGCYQIVLYYEKFLAGWIVESLAVPWWNNHFLQGGSSKDIGNKGLLEIVSIDSRIRLYEARFPMVLLEFLALLSERNILRLSLSSGRKLMSTILSSLLSSMFR
ncbi:hypothetical protein JHK87_011873 [Glycine soja]|nr:hypothetical protein JHK87_011873 [Glycine soja]